MQQTEPTQPSNDATVAELSQEVIHVPLWVKGGIAIGAIIFAIQMPSFSSSLSDAIQKNRAAKAYEGEQYDQAIDRYKDLYGRYPADKDFIKHLGLSYYRAGQYVEAMETFNQLAGVKMKKNEADEINAAISDMAAKLNIKTR